MIRGIYLTTMLVDIYACIYMHSNCIHVCIIQYHPWAWYIIGFLQVVVIRVFVFIWDSVQQNQACGVIILSL